MTLPRADADFYGRWRRIKSLFTRLRRAAGLIPDFACAPSGLRIAGQLQQA
jgi:hypothetical protein